MAEDLENKEPVEGAEDKKAPAAPPAEKPAEAVETKAVEPVEAQPEKAESRPAREESESSREAKAILSDGDAAVPAAKPVAKGRKAKAPVPMGIAHIKATFNNTMVSITDLKGGVVAWSSAGKAGFKGSRKSTAFAATLVSQDAARQATARGMREVEVRVQGAGSGRESAVRALQTVGLNISVIKDVTPVPHNGCRAKKRRRV